MLLHRMILFKFDMQHDHVLKKLNFDLLTPSPGSSGGGGGMKGVCMQTIYYHVAAFVILLFGMQHEHFLNKLNFDL